MSGFDWNGNGHHDAGDSYMDYEIMNDKGNGGGSSGGGGFGCGGVVILIVVIMLIYFVFSGASWDAIDSLLGFGFLAFLVARWLFK